MSDLVQLERRDDGVAVLTLANPPVNALNTALLARLRDHARDLIDDPPRAVLVTGGPKVFAAGADIAEFGGPDEAAHVGRQFLETLETLAAIPRVTVAAVAGYALGGGCELALACDLRIAADTARLGQPEILLGIIPGGGGTQRLARLVGPSRAKDLVLSGRNVRADEALRIGLVDRVVPADEIQSAALEWAAAFASGPALAQALAKTAIDDGLDVALDEGLRREQELFVRSFETEDSRIGITSFEEHGPGKARFTGK